jgi:hypothetical protein
MERALRESSFLEASCQTRTEIVLQNSFSYNEYARSVASSNKKAIPLVTSDAKTLPLPLSTTPLEIRMATKLLR